MEGDCERGRRVTLGGDNKQQNTPAEIYASVRNNALEDAAKEVRPDRTIYEMLAAIRAMKTKAT